MAAPEFPPPFVVERTRALGFGTGPWAREQLVEAWGAPTADKYIAEAKSAGWLVSPSRGVYHVPIARDVMVVSWLTEPARSEFLVARALAAADVRAWCLSAWLRDRGLMLPEPVFVTDLTPLDAKPRAPFDRRALKSAAEVAAKRTSPPFLENLLIVPLLPASGPPAFRVELVPEAPEALQRRRMETTLAQLGLGIGGLLAYAIDEEWPREVSSELAKVRAREADSRGIPYAVDGALADLAWVAALLASLGTARVEEFVERRLRASLNGRRDEIQRWASLIGPPQPSSSWRETLANGPFPFLLAPPSLWSDMGADQAARRFRMLDRLAGS